MFVGVLLLAIGVLLLLEKTGILQGSAWDYMVPIAIIALGMDLVFKRRRKTD